MGGCGHAGGAAMRCTMDVRGGLCLQVGALLQRVQVPCTCACALQIMHGMAS